MVKITVDADCGNSPKKLFLKDFNVAFAEGNMAFLADSVTDDIVWDMVGDRRIEGRAAYNTVLDEMKSSAVSEMVVTNIITHGKEAAVNGVLQMADGEKYAFCDVYAFRSAKGNEIRAITSYVIAVE